MDEPDKTLYLVDGTGICYRAYYAFNLTTSLGVPTGAVYGFYKTLLKLYKMFNPRYVSICFDVARQNIRHEQYAEYKAHRPPTPDDLVSQINAIRKMTEYLGLNISEQEGYEADDVIATLTRYGVSKGMKIVIVTSDKDMFQLLEDDKVTVYDPGKDKMINTNTFLKDFGFASTYMIDYLSLVGDASDNVPGAEGIGKVTGTKLISEYHDIENIYKNIDSIKGKLKDKLISSKENVFLSKELVKLYDVPLHCKLNEFETKQPNNEALYSFFSEMEFKQFLQDIQLSETGAHITEALRGIPESFLSKGGNAFFYSAEDKVYIYDEVHDELLYEDKENFAKILNSFDSKKIITFDIQSMPDDIVNILRGKDCFDIKIAAYLADSGLVNYQIETLSVRFLSEHLPGNDFIAKARYVYLLYQKLKNVLKEDKTEKLFYDIEMPLLFILHDMKKAGVYFDLKKAKKIEKKVAEEMDGIRKEIFDEAGEEFNLNSPSQIGHILFEKLKLPVIKKNKTGFSTGEEVLEKLSKDFKIAGHILEYRKLNKLSGTYITPLEVAAASDGYIHANFNQTVTQTGRLSSSSPNLQSIPAKGKFSDILRSVFKSSFSDGSLLACDYSQIELVIMAHFSGEKNLLKAFSTGEDVHTYTAALLFDIKKDEVTPAQRAVAKRVNFGVLYGMGQYGLARELDISPFQAQQFIDNYFLRYSDVEKYLRKVEETAQKNGYITTILGRRRYFPDFKNTNKNLIDFAKRQAVNTPIQGSCADIIKQAMVNIASEFDRRKLKARLIMQIHDELIFDVPKNELKEVKSIAKKCMETAVKLNIPIKVKIKEGPDWGSMKEVSDAG